MNLNPEFDLRKYNRVKALAKKYVNLIGKHLVQEVKNEERKNFNQFLESGGKLTYLELRKLNSVYRGDYIKKRLEEDDETQEYVLNTLDFAEGVGEEVQELFAGLKDIKEDF